MLSGSSAELVCPQRGKQPWRLNQDMFAAGNVSLDTSQQGPRERKQPLVPVLCSQGRLLGIKDVFTPAIAEVAVALSGACDPQVAKNAQRIYDELARWGVLTHDHETAPSCS